MNLPTLIPRRRAMTAAALLLLAGLCSAGDGHDHGDAAPAAAGTASPRIEAHSDLFELVGIVDKGQMTVYLDRYATNEPVPGARIEYESGPHKGIATAQADGSYLIRFDALGKPGALAFAFTVSAGPDTDLLAADLELKDPHDHEEDMPLPWRQWLASGLAAVVALGLATLLIRKYRTARP